MDWIDSVSKVLAGGGVGYVTKWIQDAISRRRMREQLYREISNNYHNINVRVAFSQSLQGLSQGTAERFTDKLDLSFTVWNHYNDDKHRDSLFKLDEAGAISRIYEKFQRISNDYSGLVHGKEALAEVDDDLLNGSLDRDIYKRISTPDAWHYMDDLLQGKRDNWRKHLNPF
jgi:hypothetical protein